MTHDEFNRLYDNCEINIKIFQTVETDGTEKTVESFEYCGKFYLRIHSIFEYVTGERAFGKKYRMSRESHFIKEFDSKDHANNYFLKISKNFKRVV